MNVVRIGLASCDDLPWRSHGRSLPDHDLAVTHPNDDHGDASEYRQGEKRVERERRRRELTSSQSPDDPRDRTQAPRADRLSLQEMRQVVGQLGRGGVTIGGIFVQALEADRLDVQRDVAPHLRQGQRFVGQYPPQRVDIAAALDRSPTRQQLVQNDSQRIDVGRRPDLARPAFRLLGSHIGRRSQHRLAGRDSFLGSEQLGDPEIRHPRHKVLRRTLVEATAPEIRAAGGISNTFDGFKSRCTIPHR